MLIPGAEGLVQLHVAPVEQKQLAGISQELGFPSWNWDLAFPCTLKMNQNCCFVGNQEKAFHGEANGPPSLGFPKSKMFLSLHNSHHQEHFWELWVHTNSSVMEPDHTNTSSHTHPL